MEESKSPKQSYINRMLDKKINIDWKNKSKNNSGYNYNHFNRVKFNVGVNLFASNPIFIYHNVV